MNWAAIIWFAAMVVFLIVEAACPIHLVSIWFAAGSFVAAIVGFLGGSLWLQVLMLLVVSGGLLALLWPFTWSRGGSSWMCALGLGREAGLQVPIQVRKRRS